MKLRVILDNSAYEHVVVLQLRASHYLKWNRMAQDKLQELFLVAPGVKKGPLSKEIIKLESEKKQKLLFLDLCKVLLKLLPPWLSPRPLEKLLLLVVWWKQQF